MAEGQKTSGLQFLTVAAAAERLGVSRLRLREAAAAGAIPSQRDNEGRLRLDLTGVTLGDVARPAADTLVDLLFDEVEELQAELAARGAEVAALSDLAGRQDAALAAAEAALSQGAADLARLGAVLDRAMAHLEADVAARERLAGVTERALDRLDDTGAQLAGSLSQTARFEALAARALDAAEAARRPGDAGALGAAADRALALLDDALGRAETEQRRGAETEALLDRALAAGERMEQDLATQAQTITRQQSAVEAALAVSERAVAVAGQAKHAPRKGFFRRLFGI